MTALAAAVVICTSHGGVVHEALSYVMNGQNRSNEKDSEYMKIWDSSRSLVDADSTPAVTSTATIDQSMGCVCSQCCRVAPGSN